MALQKRNYCITVSVLHEDTEVQRGKGVTPGNWDLNLVLPSSKAASRDALSEAMVPTPRAAFPVDHGAHKAGRQWERVRRRVLSELTISTPLVAAGGPDVAIGGSAILLRLWPMLKPQGSDKKLRPPF